MDLQALGWNNDFAENFASYKKLGYEVARVTSQHKNIYRLIGKQGELVAQVSGKLHYQADQVADFPAVGDWVVISCANENTAVIHAILPRQTKFSRKIAGKTTQEQIVAANINTVFIVNALNKDFNLRRIERYLTLVWESGANPVIVLSKSDLCQELQQRIYEVESIAFGVPVHAISALNKQGLEKLAQYFSNGNTVALLGSSGVGKSTLVNEILGTELLKVNEVREGDDRGRHTTTHRELFVLPQGGIIIDTPGMRELQLWGSAEGAASTFEDIEDYARQCYFSDCQHESEPKCAVRKALAEGLIDPARYESYLKQQKELAYLSDRQDYLDKKEKMFKNHIIQQRQIKKKR